MTIVPAASPGAGWRPTRHVFATALFPHARACVRPAPRVVGKNSPKLVLKLVKEASGVLNSASGDLRPATARSGQMKFRPCSGSDTWSRQLSDGGHCVITTAAARCTTAVARRVSSARFPPSIRSVPHRSRPAISCQGEVSSDGAPGGSRRDALRIIAIAALALGSILAGCRPALAQPRPSAFAGAASPTHPFVSAQVQPAPAAPVVPAPSSDRPIGLPRVRDYAPIPELRDIYFDSGKEAIRPGDVTLLAANAAWLRAHPDHLLLIEGHSDNRGTTNDKNELNMDLGERRAQAAMNHLVALGVDPSRITILSYGEERPQCTEESERCWSRNRRSRFLVKPP
jgi:peptidoglycan-associated lipoprotein